MPTLVYNRLMRYGWLLIALLFTLPVQAAEYIESLGDVPLMPGLIVQHEHTVIFDVPEGRVVEVSATGTDAAAITRFYADSLPQLGWQRTGTNNYHRESEYLDITLKQQDAGVLITFSLKPQ